MFLWYLKKRFSWFKVPNLMRDVNDVKNVFITACILHNMILSHDGLDHLWEDFDNWKTLNPIVEEEIDDNDAAQDAEAAIDEENDLFLKNYIPVLHDDENFNPVYIGDLISSDEIERYNVEGQQFERLRALLANHLSILYRKGLLRWPKPRSQIKKQFNLVPREVFPDAGDIIDA